MSLAHVRLVFLDMDGTLYRGRTLFPTTPPFLAFLAERGVDRIFLSNNSSFSTAQYVDKLAALGLAARPDEFYTSSLYAIDYLRAFHPAARRIHFFGMPDVAREFAGAGFDLASDAPDAVVIAFHRDFHYRDLCRAAYFLRMGVPGFATHPDPFCPTDEPTWLPDCGALAACLETATGAKLTVLGKPDPGMLLTPARRRGLAPGQTLMVGDRLSTDIALGRAAGALTCQILAEGADLAPPADVVPDFRVKDLGEIQALWAASTPKEMV